jgi:hypothetical protein
MARHPKRIISLCIMTVASLFILSGCQSATPVVNTNAIPSFNPSNYASFAILEQAEASMELVDPAIYRSARMVMTNALRAKGFNSADLESADLVFQASGANLSNANATDYGFFYRSYGWDWYPVTYLRTSQTNQSSGAVVLSAFDNKTKELVWQGGGSITSYDSSDINAQTGLEVLKQILAQFPAR